MNHENHPRYNEALTLAASHFLSSTGDLSGEQIILALEGDDPVIIDTEVPEKLKYQGESLVPVLVKAVQELSAQVQALQAEIATLKGN